MKEAIITRFDDEKIDIVVRSRISKRTLKNGESVTDYFNELRREANKINLDDEALLFSFIQGLPENFAEQIVVQNPRTPNDALQIAKTLEQLKLMYKTNDQKSALESMKKEMAKDAKISAAQGQTNIYKENKELKETLTEMIKSQKARKRDPQTRIVNENAESERARGSHETT